KELIAQNHAALLRLWPDAPAGIYSAGLGKRQAHDQILFAGVQSVARQVERIGHVDLVIIDEAHLIPRARDTLYGKLLDGLHAINPALKAIGLTATPYRLDSGSLTEGTARVFDGIAYDIPVAMLVERGYLAPLISKRPGTLIETEGLHKRGGEFIGGELEAVANRDDLTEAAVSEMVALGADRRGWIVFCVSVDHAHKVRAAIRTRGLSCETVTGDTPSTERSRIIAAYKAQQIRALTSVGVLTTGFDAPHTDLIAMLRPTASTGLYVQIAGRGMRTAPGKENCLVLDFAGNVMRHGPVDAIPIPGVKRAYREGEPAPPLPGTPPAKACPECGSIVAPLVRECLDCGYLWPERAPEHDPEASDDPIMLLTAPAPQWEPVLDVDYSRHRKDGSPDSLCVEYLVGGRVVREWVCFEHAGYARQKAVGWFQARCPGQPVPDTITEALAVTYPAPTQAILKREGKYWRLDRVSFAEPARIAS
ncbi:MAG: helicase-related protein, partial [Pseudomonadota bacterium]